MRCRSRCSSCAVRTPPSVGDEDVAELVRRQPNAQVVVVEQAGHSIQGDQPLELAGIIAARLDGSTS